MFSSGKTDLATIPIPMKKNNGLIANKIDPHHSMMQDNFIRHYNRVDINLLNCNPDPEILAIDISADYLNYFTPGTPAGGISEVHYFQKVLYKNIYPGIDLEFLCAANENKSSGFKYNFIIHPGANINDIQLAYAGAADTWLQDNLLMIKVQSGTFAEKIPKSYWKNSGEIVSVKYSSAGKNVFGFSFPGKRSDDDLVIDPNPCLMWGTYFGGPGRDIGTALVLDPSNNILITGWTFSLTNIASSGTYQSQHAGYDDAFIAKFNPTGSLRLWSTYYGGVNADEARDLSLDSYGNIFVAGITSSTSGIATAGSYQTTYGGGAGDVFVSKFNPAGTALLWGTYYGGLYVDQGMGIATDANDNVIFAGNTVSTNAIATTGAFQSFYGGGMNGAFVAKLDSSGSSLLWGTYYGQGGDLWCYAFAVDSADNVFISGVTRCLYGISTPGAYKDTLTGAYDAFIAKFDPTGSTLLWGTYFGGESFEDAWGMALDRNDNVLIAGITSSTTGIATPGAYETSHSSGNIFVAKVKSSGDSLIWGTYYGDTTNNNVQCLALDASGYVYVSGFTSTLTGIATPGAYQTAFAGGNADAYVAKFNPACSSLEWGSYYGGTGDDFSSDIVVDASANVFLLGVTTGADGIATPGGFYNTYQGGTEDAFVIELSCNPNPASINSIDTKGEISIFPNPNNGSFTVAFPSAASGTIARIEIYDVFGRYIYEYELPQNSATTIINTQLGNGVYLYMLINGSENSSGRLVIVK